MKKIILFLFFSTNIYANFFTSLLQKQKSSIPEKLKPYSAPELLARANQNDGYNLPPGTIINNTSPVISDRGDVAFKIWGIENTAIQGLWGKFFSEENGKVIVRAPDERFITDPEINNKGQVVYSYFDEGVTDGVFVFDLEKFEEEQIIDPSKYSISYYTYPQILDSGDIFFRGTDDQNDRTLYKFSSGQLKTILKEGKDVFYDEIKKAPSSYIFRPHVNNAGQIAFKLRLGNRYDWGEDQIDVMSLYKDDKINVQAVDVDGDQYSQFKSMSNSVSINSKGKIAMIGFLVDGSKVIYTVEEKLTNRFLLDNLKDVSDVEYFTPKINDLDEIFFRGKDAEGRRAIFKLENDTVTKLIHEGQEIQTDLGLATILWNKYYPGLSGEIDVNNNGDFVFHALLVLKESQKEIGAGIFVVRKNKLPEVEKVN